MILKLAKSHSGLISQLGMDINELKEMAEQAENDKELMKLSGEEKTMNDQKLWCDWINEYKYFDASLIESIIFVPMSLCHYVNKCKIACPF